MELRHLRYFVAVAQEENVSRAAARLGVSQPGISSQLRDLEEEVGFALFVRQPRSMQLSAAGRIFLGEAREILARAAGAVEKVRAGLASGAEIHVGYAPSGTAEILPRALRAMQRLSPSLRVTLHDLSVEEMLPWLRQGRLDVALTLPPHKLPRGLAMRELERYEMCVAVGAMHPLARAKRVRLDQMAAGPVATYARRDYPGYNKHLQKQFAAAGCKLRVGSEHDGLTSLLAAIAAGREFTLVPSCVRALTGPDVRLLKLRPALPSLTIVALWRKDAETENVRAFVAAALTERPEGEAKHRQPSRRRLVRASGSP